MTKKHDFLRSEQSRDKQAGHSGKAANDHNKMGEQTPTQKNEGRRTPQSRHDRQSKAGSGNVVEARTGGKGGGRSPRGAG